MVTGAIIFLIVEGHLNTTGLIVLTTVVAVGICDLTRVFHSQPAWLVCSLQCRERAILTSDCQPKFCIV